MVEAPGRTPAPASEATRAAAIEARREALEQSLAGRFWLRFHASVLVSGTFATGFLANAAMLQWPVHSVWLRWPLAVIAGYAAFFALVRLWLAYVGIKPLFGPAHALDDRRRERGGWGFDLPSGGGGGGSGGGSFGGAGGGSGGGGASALFDAPSAPLAAPSNPGASLVSGARSSGSGAGSKLGSLFDGADLGDGCLVVVLGLVVLALVAALVGGAIHLVWIAPDLLSDAAFAAMLSAGVVPGLKRAREPDWNGRVFRATLPVLAIVMAVVLAAAWAFTRYFPGLRTLGEAWRMLF
jgi:hypothetical protein